MCSEYTISKNCGNIAAGFIKKFKSGVAMSFVILRTTKLKTAGEIGGSLGHTFRIMKTPNADKSKLHLNEHEFSLDQIKQNIKDRLPDKVRKNGVRVVEYLITGSPDWLGWGTDAEKKFFDSAKKWLVEKHGFENVVGLSIHRDETTPHLVAYVVPIDENGKLNARGIFGGKGKMSAMQSSFADQVKELGLERGIEGSRAKHTTIKQFYAEIQQPLENADVKRYAIHRFSGDLPPPKFLEKNETYAQRVIDVIYEDVNRKVAKLADHYANYIEKQHHDFEQFKRFEMKKHEIDKKARYSAERASIRYKQMSDDAERKRLDHVIAAAELTYSRINEIENKYRIYQRFENYFRDDALKLKRQIEIKLYQHADECDVREKDWALREIEHEIDRLKKDGSNELAANELSHKQDLRLYEEKEQQLLNEIESVKYHQVRKEAEQEQRHKNEIDAVRERIREREHQLSHQKEQQRVREYEQQLRHQSELQSYSRNNDIEFDM